jgi:hypothetical protein
MAQLKVLRTPDGKKIETIKKICGRWKDVGDLLDFDPTGATLNQIQADRWGEGVESCCRAMFQLWLEGNGRQPASWATLLRVLRDSDFNALAADLEKALRSPATDSSLAS